MVRHPAGVADGDVVLVLSVSHRSGDEQVEGLVGYEEVPSLEGAYSDLVEAAFENASRLVSHTNLDADVCPTRSSRLRRFGWFLSCRTHTGLRLVSDETIIVEETLELDPLPSFAEKGPGAWFSWVQELVDEIVAKYEGQPVLGAAKVLQQRITQRPKKSKRTYCVAFHVGNQTQ